jgi:hypothetical protein
LRQAKKPIAANEEPLSLLYSQVNINQFGNTGEPSDCKNIKQTTREVEHACKKVYIRDASMKTQSCKMEAVTQPAIIDQSISTLGVNASGTSEDGEFLQVTLSVRAKLDSAE